ncbi:MAG: hypothetical protein HKN24_08985 [Acidimicrobiales bacterium]|nr:hypothetical protein [Acidimicrobiales bacterium]
MSVGLDLKILLATTASPADGGRVGQSLDSAPTPRVFVDVDAIDAAAKQTSPEPAPIVSRPAARPSSVSVGQAGERYVVPSGD